MSTRPVQATTVARKLSIPQLVERSRQQKLVMVTAYDAPTARVSERAGVDLILIGDSLAMVALGHDSTLQVTMDEMLHHARAARRGAPRTFMVGDLPFLSYQPSTELALENAGAYLRAGLDAVKLEGGAQAAPTVRALVDAGIPVLGHIGLLPQHMNVQGGYRVQGKTAQSARELLQDALALQDAGCFAIVIEGVPAEVGELLTDRLAVPTIGIGAGKETCGQVLVANDLLGFGDGSLPRFVQRFGDMEAKSVEAVAKYAAAVRAEEFPAPQHCYSATEKLDPALFGATPTENPNRPPAATELADAAFDLEGRAVC